MLNTAKPVIVGISGASGAVIGQRTVDELLRRRVPTIAVCSNGGKLVWQDELGCSFNDSLAEWMEDPNFTHYPINHLRAPIASGTFATAGMVIAPCSMNSAASLAHGLSNNLLLRAADVCLKEGRKLVLVAAGNPAPQYPPGKPADSLPYGRGHPAPPTRLLLAPLRRRGYSRIYGTAYLGSLGRTGTIAPGIAVRREEKADGNYLY